jgi:hypothetical protein
MANKVVDIGSGRKPDEPCQFCGAVPEHPGVSCPRIEEVEFHEDGMPAFVKFFHPDVWKPE